MYILYDHKRFVARVFDEQLEVCHLVILLLYVFAGSKFGTTTNSKGYKLLPPYLRIIQVCYIQSHIMVIHVTRVQSIYMYCRYGPWSSRSVCHSCLGISVTHASWTEVIHCVCL